MTKYRVDLVQTVYEGATLYVDADSEEQAGALALEHAYDDGVQWRFTESVGNADIINIELERKIS